jgi:glycosyltransferase involved in cell wall biosynthesis
MRVLVAVPVFNEERYVSDVIREVRQYCDDVLVIDDGSTDRTAEILGGIDGVVIIRHPENRGYGQSLIDAFAYAHQCGYHWVITIDCDEQHEPRQIPEFIARAALEDADIISGSRYLTTLPGNTDAPTDRREINQTITAVINDRLGLRLTDTFCGFKAYRVDAVARMNLSVVGYAFPMQFWVQAVATCARICELAVPLIYIDPTRHFGGILDDPQSRLAHYLEVFENESARVRETGDEIETCRASRRSNR